MPTATTAYTLVTFGPHAGAANRCYTSEQSARRAASRIPSGTTVRLVRVTAASAAEARRLCRAADISDTAGIATWTA